MSKTFCISLIARIHVVVKVILPSHRLISYVTRHQKDDVRYSNQVAEFLLLPLHKKTYFIERQELVQRVLPLVYFSTHKYKFLPTYLIIHLLLTTTAFQLDSFGFGYQHGVFFTIGQMTKKGTLSVIRLIDN